MLRGCIERRGERTSVVKDTAAKLLAVAQGLSGLFVGDEIVKASLASYTFEHMEIASYRILIAAAEVVGDPETKRVCEEILREEEAMASWLEQNVSAVTQQYLKREQTPGRRPSIRRFAGMFKRIKGKGVRTIIVETADRRDLMVQEVGYAPGGGINLIAASQPRTILARSSPFRGAPFDDCTRHRERPHPRKNATRAMQVQEVKVSVVRVFGTAQSLN